MAGEPRLIIGCGYLGRRVAAVWTESRHQVYATSRSDDRLRQLSQEGIQPVQWDVLDAGSKRLPDADVVLYCVGFDRNAGVAMRDVYVDGLQNTLQRLGRVHRFFYVSSTGVYGDADGEWVDESTPPNPIDAAGEICLEAEACVARHCQEYGTPYVIYRLAGIYGPGRMIGAAALQQGKPIAADPNVHLNLIEVSDAARVIDAASRTASLSSNLYNVSDGSPVRRVEFYHEVARLLQSPAPTFDSPSARRSRGDRRISNRRMMTELRPALQYPDYRSGLANALREHSQDA